MGTEVDLRNGDAGASQMAEHDPVAVDEVAVAEVAESNALLVAGYAETEASLFKKLKGFDNAVQEFNFGWIENGVANNGAVTIQDDQARRRRIVRFIGDGMLFKGLDVFENARGAGVELDRDEHGLAAILFNDGT